MKKLCLFLLLLLCLPSNIKAETIPGIRRNSSIGSSIDHELKDITYENIRFNPTTQSISGYIKNLTPGKINVETVLTFKNESNILFYHVIKTDIEANETISIDSIIDEDKTIINTVKYYMIDSYNITLLDFNEDTLKTHGDYALRKYHVDIKVLENNIYEITENITAYFDKSTFDITREIPLYNEIYRKDGTNTYDRVSIRNISINNDYVKDQDDLYLRLKIKPPLYTQGGEVNYTIKYTCELHYSKIMGNDEFLFNIISDQWDTSILKPTFKITMPKKFDSSKITFSTRHDDLEEDDKIEYTVDGNIIKGTYNGILEPRKGIIIRQELPKNYFSYFTPSLIILFMIPALCLICGLLLWLLFGKEDQVTEIVEFYPPKDLSSLDASLWYYGEIKEEGILSILIILANKGYIKIDELNEKQPIPGKNNFKITKLKEYDGDIEEEHIFFNGLFYNNQDESSGLRPIEVVYESYLKNDFYKIISKIAKLENKRKIRERIYTNNFSIKHYLLLFLILIALFSTIMIPSLDNGGFIKGIITYLFFLLFIPPLYKTVTGWFTLQDRLLY